MYIEPCLCKLFSTHLDRSLGRGVLVEKDTLRFYKAEAQKFKRMTGIILTKSIVVRRTCKQSSGRRLLPQQEYDFHHFACAEVLCLGYEDDINTHRQHITEQHNENTVNTHSPSPLSALLD